MNDQTALARSEPVNPVVQFKQQLEVVARDLEMLDDKAKARMRSAAVIAVVKDPDLLRADRQSLMMAVRMCAQHGVMPDGNEATLQVYSTKAKGADGKEVWIKKVQYMPMIRGIINRVLRSGKVLSFWAEMVHEGEEFRLDTSQGDRRPEHIYNPLSRTGKPIGAYSVARLTNGSVDCEVMTSADIAKVRNVAKTKNVWDQWFEEKAKVAVMRRHSKRLALSAEDMAFIINEDEHDLSQAEVPSRELTPLQRKAMQARGQPIPEAAGEIVDGEVVHWTEAESGEDADPSAPAFEEGAKAYGKGVLLEGCPHDEGTDEAVSWIGGWRGAQMAGASE